MFKTSDLGNMAALNIPPGKHIYYEFKDLDGKEQIKRHSVILSQISASEISERGGGKRWAVKIKDAFKSSFLSLTCIDEPYDVEVISLGIMSLCCNKTSKRAMKPIYWVE